MALSFTNEPGTVRYDITINKSKKGLVIIHYKSKMNNFFINQAGAMPSKRTEKSRNSPDQSKQNFAGLERRKNELLCSEGYTN
jgi:hypothetical protein